MEKRVDCTCIYVLNASSKGSGQTAQMRRLVGAQTQFKDGPRSELSIVARIGNKNHCQLGIHVSKYTCTSGVITVR